jgi:hypothetical protein
MKKFDLGIRDAAYMLTIFAMLILILTQKDEFNYPLFKQFGGLSVAIFIGLIAVVSRLSIAVAGHFVSVAKDHGDDDYGYPEMDYRVSERNDWKPSNLNALFEETGSFASLKDRHK